MELIEHIVTGCCRGDRQSQNTLYKQFSPKMMIVCLRYARNREEAEEILQEGFLLVFSKINQFRNKGSIEGWIRKIMVNAALQKIRSRSVLTKVISIDNVTIEDSAAIPTDTIGAKELIKLIQELPTMYKTVFNLYVFEGMKHKEIAELLGISEGTSKSNLSDARSLLQHAVNRLHRISKPINF